MPDSDGAVVCAARKERARRVPLDAPDLLAVLVELGDAADFPASGRRARPRHGQPKRVHAHDAVAAGGREQLRRAADVRSPRDRVDGLSVLEGGDLAPGALALLERPDGRMPIRVAEQHARRPRRVLPPGEAGRARDVELVDVAPLPEVHHVERLVHAELAVRRERA